MEEVCSCNKSLYTSTIKYILLFMLVFALNHTYANTVNANPVCPPSYTAGGSLSYLSVLDAYNSIPCMEAEWWYLAALLKDNTGSEHSLQVMLLNENGIPGMSIGAGVVGFTFKMNEKEYYLWTGYPDEILSSAGLFISNPLIHNNFDIAVKSMLIDYHFYHDPIDTTHGIGQVGARYILTAKGIGKIGVDHLKPADGQQVNYSLSINLVDMRGMLPEAYNGVVGSDTIQSSWELAAPSMIATNWNITITTKSPLPETTLSFMADEKQNNNIWFDRQVLYKNPFISSKPYAKAMHVLLAKKFPNIISDNGDLSAPRRLYRGTWMSFCLNTQEYANYCGEGVAFWQEGIPTSQMDSRVNATFGFMNLYTPKSDLEIGNSLTVFLPTDTSSKKEPPYRIFNDPSATFTSPLTNNTYAGGVYLSVDPNSTMGTILNLHSLQKSVPFMLKFIAISSQTENVFFEADDSFYEGAANVFLCSSVNNCSKDPIGTGYLEQMGYS